MPFSHPFLLSELISAFIVPVNSFILIKGTKKGFSGNIRKTPFQLGACQCLCLIDNLRPGHQGLE